MADYNRMLEEDQMDAWHASKWLRDNPKEAIPALKKKAKEKGVNSIHELFPGTRPGSDVKNIPIDDFWSGWKDTLGTIADLGRDADEYLLGGLGSGTADIVGDVLGVDNTSLPRVNRNLPTETSRGKSPSLDDLTKSLDPKILKELERGSVGPNPKEEVSEADLDGEGDDNEIDYRSPKEQMEDEIEVITDMLNPEDQYEDPDFMLDNIGPKPGPGPAPEQKKTLEKPAKPYGKYQDRADLIKNMRNDADAMDVWNKSGTRKIPNRAKDNLEADADGRQTKMLQDMKNDDRKSRRQREREEIEAARKKRALDNPAPETVKEGTTRGHGFVHAPPTLVEDHVPGATTATMSEPPPAPIPDRPDVGEFQSSRQPRTPTEYPDYFPGGTPGQDAVVDIANNYGAQNPPTTQPAPIPQLTDRELVEGRQGVRTAIPPVDSDPTLGMPAVPPKPIVASTLVPPADEPVYPTEGMPPVPPKPATPPRTSPPGRVETETGPVPVNSDGTVTDFQGGPVPEENRGAPAPDPQAPAPQAPAPQAPAPAPAPQAPAPSLTSPIPPGIYAPYGLPSTASMGLKYRDPAASQWRNFPPDQSRQTVHTGDGQVMSREEYEKNRKIPIYGKHGKIVGYKGGGDEVRKSVEKYGQGVNLDRPQSGIDTAQNRLDWESKLRRAEVKNQKGPNPFQALDDEYAQLASNVGMHPSEYKSVFGPGGSHSKKHAAEIIRNNNPISPRYKAEMQAKTDARRRKYPESFPPERYFPS